jgi:BAI1-associated protein 3
LQEFAVDQESLFNYLQNAFKERVHNHMDLLKATRLRTPPKIRLIVEIIEAKDLASIHSTDLINPFVTLNLASDDSTAGSYETEEKLETSRPVWNEKCLLSVEGSEK